MDTALLTLIALVVVCGLPTAFIFILDKLSSIERKLRTIELGMRSISVAQLEAQQRRDTALELAQLPPPQAADERRLTIIGKQVFAYARRLSLPRTQEEKRT
jgi:hypothetical protein